MSSAARRLPVVLVLLLVGAATAYGVKHWQARRAPTPQEPVFYGNVDIRDVTLAFRVGGRVESVLKGEGDEVRPGETLARLDAAPYRAALAQARAAVAVARAQLARVQAGSRREDVSEAKARLVERQAVSRRADETLDRYALLAKNGAIPEQTLSDARSAAEQARANVSATEASLARVVEGSRVEEIAVARAQLAQAEAGIASAELAVADTELKAAEVGTIVTRTIERGAIVTAGAPALVVAFDDPVWIRAFASEHELARLAPGAAVDVYSDSRPGQPYRGKVGYVATEAEFTPKNVETAELRSSLVYRFRVIVAAHDGGLRQGMPVTLRLATTRAGSR